MASYSKSQFYNLKKKCFIWLTFPHRLRPIDTHLAQYTMLYNNSAKNRYAEPVHNKTKQIQKIRD